MRTALVVLVLGLRCVAMADPQVFEDRSFKEAKFSRSDFAAATFDTCLFDTAYLHDPKGSELKIEGGELSKLSLRDTKLPNTYWYGVEAREGKFERGTLEDSSFDNVVLDEMKFERCQARRQYWRNCDMRELYFDHVDMPDARFDSVTARNGRFDYSDFSWGRVSNCEFDTTRFERGSMRGAGFWGTDFTDVRLDGCNIHGMTINGIDVEEALRKAGR